MNSPGILIFYSIYKKNTTAKISIEKIRSLGVINSNLLNTWADCCTVLLEFRNHNSPVNFNIDGEICS
jgi:hypothetical protein